MLSNRTGLNFCCLVKVNVGKGDNTAYQQLLLFLHCFQKAHENEGLFGNGLTLYKMKKI